MKTDEVKPKQYNLKAHVVKSHVMDKRKPPKVPPWKVLKFPYDLAS